MKKILALSFAILMVMSFAACGKDNDKNNDSSVATPDSAVVTMPETMTNNKVQEYVDTKGDELVASMEQAFASSSGMTCTSTIKAVGNGFVIDININELTGITDEQKAQLQQSYDAMDEQFEENLKTMQNGLPELEYMTVNVCDKDGEFLAAVKAGD